MGETEARAGDGAGAARAVAQPPAGTGRCGARGTGRARRLRRPPLSDRPALPLQPAPHAVARSAGPALARGTCPAGSISPPCASVRTPSWASTTSRHSAGSRRASRRPDHAPRAVGRLVAGPARTSRLWVFEIEANAFCHQMVRSIVGHARGRGPRTHPGRRAARDRSKWRPVAERPAGPVPRGFAWWAWDTRRAWSRGDVAARRRRLGRRHGVRSRLAVGLGVFYR